MAKAGLSVAIAGATGLVGKEMAAILAERAFPVRNLAALASDRQSGRRITFDGQEHDVLNLADFDFSDYDIALFSAGSKVSAEYAPRAAQAGCLVVDNSSHFRYDDDVPLVVAEVNPQHLAELPRGIVANPNCSTMQLMVALKPLHDEAALERLIVSTYQAVSGAGSKAIEELSRQSAALLSGQRSEAKVFTDTIAFNVIPHIDSFEDNGFTREEMKIAWETRKILAADDIKVAATAVRVPVFHGHSAAVYIETRDPLSAFDARELLAAAPGVRVIDRNDDGGYPTPLSHAAGKDEVLVGRIRDDYHISNGLHLWIVADNLRKGAALNAVQLAELLAGRLRNA